MQCMINFYSGLHACGVDLHKKSMYLAVVNQHALSQEHVRAPTTAPYTSSAATLVVFDYLICNLFRVLLQVFRILVYQFCRRQFPIASDAAHYCLVTIGIVFILELRTSTRRAYQGNVPIILRLIHLATPD
jgi:hypothetical protein